MHTQNLVDEKVARSQKLSDVVGDGVFPHLFAEAERVRWRLIDIDWSAIDRSKVTPGLVALTRETARAEMTTSSATNALLKEFPDDVDFTQWLAVWLYEETKHPLVLMRWLHEFGVTFDSDNVLEGRQIYPFVQSPLGTLMMNVFSEILASQFYLTLYQHAPEPILKRIARNLAGDEARHSSHFFTFAKRTVERAEDRKAAISIVLKVMYFWLEMGVTHPVNLLVQRVTTPELSAVVQPEVWYESVAKARARMMHITSALVGRQLTCSNDLLAAMV
jgi:hypothetical protein